jgi:hypothetical protein
MIQDVLGGDEGPESTGGDAEPSEFGFEMPKIDGSGSGVE